MRERIVFAGSDDGQNVLRSSKHEKSGDSAATCRGHDSEDGALAPDSIVAEGLDDLDDLDALPGWRFACWPLPPEPALGCPLA